MNDILNYNPNVITSWL